MYISSVSPMGSRVFNLSVIDITIEVQVSVADVQSIPRGRGRDSDVMLSSLVLGCPWYKSSLSELLLFSKLKEIFRVTLAKKMVTVILNYIT